MPMQALRLRAIAFLAGFAILAFSGWAGADPPSRVARLGYLGGAVSFSPAGENDWDRANINRPLTTGDRLWTDRDGRAEIQVGGAMVRMHAETSVSVLNLDDRMAQLQLTQGTLNVRVRRLEPDQVFEVDTPNLAFTLRRPGEYRIEVDPEGDATTIIVRQGQGEAYGEDAAYVIDAEQPYRFRGNDLSDYQYVDAPRLDEFDRWTRDRDHRYDNSGSARYVSRDVVGYQDLDDHGSWRADATYGNVWIPSRVATGWAPYRDGHWAWIDPWGWTWVDDAPWGFAVSHYGRWAHLRGTWAWVPGPVRSRSYYAPAVVAFVGGANFQLTISSGNVGGVAWFPLGPREVYRPTYPVSRRYFENVNRSNTVINTTVINNYYNNSNVTNVVYANRQVPGAVVAVPTTAFVQSQRVSGAAVQVSREMLVSAPVAVGPAVAPTEKSVRGAAAQGNKPPPRVFERPVVARSAPPAAPVGFAAQEQQLKSRPGTPLDAAARQQLKPAATAPAPAVKVVAQKQEAPPTVRPPPAAAGARPGDARGRSDERKAPAAPGVPGAPEAPAQGAGPAQDTPPVPAAQGPEQRGRSEQRDKDEQRGRPEAPPPPPERAAKPKAAPAQAAPSAADAPPLEQRGKSQQRDKDEQRGRPAAPPPRPPERPVEPPAAPPQAAPSAPDSPPPQQRGKSEQRDKDEQRERPAAPPPRPPERPVEPPAAPPQAAPSAPDAPPPEQRGRSEQRDKGEQRGRPAAPPPRPPERPVEPPAAPPQAASPAPGAQPLEQRGKSESRSKGEQRAQPTAPPPERPVEQKAAVPPQVAPPAPPPAPRAEPRGQEPKPATGKPDAKKKDRDELERELEREREEEIRRQAR